MAEVTPYIQVALPAITDTQTEINRSLIAAIRSIDAHDHDPDRGRKIRMSRVDILDNVDFNRNKVRLLSAASFTGDEPNVIDNNSLFTRSGNLFFKDGQGREIKLTQDGRNNNLIINADTGNNIQVNFGFSAVQPGASNNAANALAAIQTSFGNINNRSLKNLNSLLIGGRFRADAPAAAGHYWVWLAVKTVDLLNNNIFYSPEFENQNNFWEEVADTQDIGGTNYKLFYNILTIPSGGTGDWIVRTYL